MRTLAPEVASLAVTAGVETTRTGLAEVEESTASVGISLGPGGTLAEEAPVLVDALGSGPAGVAQAFIEIDTPSVGIAGVAVLTGAGVVPGVVMAQGVGTARIGLAAFVNVSTLDLPVSLEAGLALADVLGGEVAALRVLHTLPGQFRDPALVNILTGIPIPLVARETGAVERTNVISAMCEHIARPVFALIVVRHTTALPTPPIVTMALGV